MKTFKNKNYNTEVTSYLFNNPCEFFSWIENLFNEGENKTDLEEVLDYLGEEIRNSNLFITKSDDGQIIVTQVFL